MKSSAVLLAFLFILPLGSIALAWDLTGKEAEELQRKNAKLEEQIKQLQEQLQIQKIDSNKELRACQDKLAIEAKRGSGIKIIFFGGDIIYELNTAAFTDYRAGLRLRSIHDQIFAESMGNFENGRGGDMEMLSLLKEIDVSKDRMIDETEAQDFRKNEEAK